MKKILPLCGLLAMGLANVASAGSGDPIEVTLSPASGFPTTQIGHQSLVVYTLTNRIPLPAPVKILTSYGFQGGTFGVHDNCKGRSLNFNQSCRIIFTFKPQNTDIATLNLLIGYHNNRVPQAPLHARGSGKPVDASVSGAVSGLSTVLNLTPPSTPTVTFTYTNTGQVAVTGNSGDAGGNIITSSNPAVATVAITSNTCGINGAPLPLAPNASCEVRGTVTPVSAGDFTLTGLYTYDGTKTVMPTASARVEQGSGSCQIDATTYLPLPTTAYQYSDNMVKFRFTNNCNVSSGVLSGVGVNNSLGSNATTRLADDPKGCSNGQTLAPGASCYLLASAIPNVTGNMTVTGEVTAGGHTASAHTSATVMMNDYNQHKVHFINQCPFTVWYGIANGNGQPASSFDFSPDPTPGSQSTLGAPSDSYKLNAQVPGQAPSTIDLAVTQYTNGAIWPRTDCKSDGTNFACTTGQCDTLSPTSGTCIVQGTSGLEQPAGPWTKFEFTIVPTAGQDGVYDTSLINGMNVPVEVKGLGPTVSSNPFACTGAGAVTQDPANGLGECSWFFDPTFNGNGGSGLNIHDLIWVSAGADDGCTNDPVGGQVCGMAFDSVPINAPINRRQGNFLGFWTVTDFIGYSSAGQWGPTVNLYNQYGFATAMSTITQNPVSYGSGALFGNLLACQKTSNDSADTCNNSMLPGPYPAATQGSNTNCCGCIPWNQAGAPVSTAVGSSDSCYFTNQDWTNTNTAGLPAGAVSPQNAVVWLKKACPTAYSYQFDDPSSSFTCTQDSSGNNILTSYQITFCPGGRSGLPEGKTEGRAVS